MSKPRSGFEEQKEEDSKTGMGLVGGTGFAGGIVGRN